MKCVPDIVFDPEQNLALDLYLPDDLSASACVIYAHGGDFTSGGRDDPDAAYVAAPLVEAGFAVASVSYRLKAKADTYEQQDKERIEAYKLRSAKVGLTLSSKLYGHRFIAAMEDISRAIEFLWVEGKRLGIRQRKVGLFGVASGGIAGLGLAYPPTHWGHRVSQPDAVVALGAAIVQPWRIVPDGPTCMMINDVNDELVDIADPQIGVARAETQDAPITLREVELGPHASLTDLVLDGADAQGVPYIQHVLDQFARLVDDE